jgi:hypothetical protein
MWRLPSGYGFEKRAQFNPCFSACRGQPAKTKALSNLILWLSDWQAKALQRAIDAKKAAVAAAQEAARKAELELRDMVSAAGKK